MADDKVIAVDLADVWEDTTRKKLLTTLAWGEPVTVEEVAAKHVKVKLIYFTEQADGSIVPSTRTGFIIPTDSGIKPAEVAADRLAANVLQVDFVDVQQGDGAVIETPAGRTILVDGGDNQLFARYLANRYRGTSLGKPKVIDCILVSHGDADHFSGLTEILKSETHAAAKKRLFIQPERVYHNGIVKRPSDGHTETQLLGKTTKSSGQTFITGLETSLLDVADAEMNAPFKAWKKALATWNKRKTDAGGPAIEFRRLDNTAVDAFGFLAPENVRVDVFAPLPEIIGGKPALKFLRDPPDGPRIGHESTNTTSLESGSLSASHTINGHSIVFRLAFGAFSYLFAGDLNDEAGRTLTRQHNSDAIKLTAEVFKVPHHGSADFSGAFIKAVEPMLSVISSGDESRRKEYIHPRATLVGTLGKYSRLEEPLVFVTELVAFFEQRGWSTEIDNKQKPVGKPYYGFSRAAFGLVKTRTNGTRLLVYTNSANIKMKEAYAFKLDDHGAPQPAAIRRA
jgi:beta-lactamase superfamily II metal-dependent hydrolase